MTTASYPDGWELPIPTKYLVVLPTNKRCCDFTTKTRIILLSKNA
jgi:hypothetical protein